MRWHHGKGGRVVSREGEIEFKDKIMLHWSKEAIYCRGLIVVI